MIRTLSIAHTFHEFKQKISKKLPKFAVITVSIAVGISMVATMASAAQSTETAQASVHRPSPSKLKVTWLENANEKRCKNMPVRGPSLTVNAEMKAQQHRHALRQVPGVQVQENNGTGGSDVSLNIGVRGLTARLLDVQLC